MSIFINSYRGFQSAPPLPPSMNFINRKSVYFNGVNQLVNMGNVLGYQHTDNFSISLWVRHNVSGLVAGYYVSKATSSTLGYSIGTIVSQLRFQIAQNSSNYRIAQTSVAVRDRVRDGKWHHLCGVWDGSNCYLYVDGVQEGTQINAGTLTNITNAGNFNIGDLNNSGLGYLGNADQCVVWNKALSAIEIKELMTLRDVSQHSAYADVESWWEFEDSEIIGTTVFDKVGSNNGTLVNSTINTTCIPWPYDYQLTTNDYTPMQNSSGSIFGGFAWDFDGTNEFINIPNSSALFAGSFAVSMWVSLDNLYTSGAGDLFGSWTTPDFSYLIRLNTGAVQFYIRQSDNTGIGGNIVTISNLQTNYNLDIGQWNHWVFVADGVNLKCYFNGVDVTSTVYTYDGTIQEGVGDDIQIGGTTNYVNAQISDVIYFDSALTSGDTVSIFNDHEPRDEMQESLSSSIQGYWRPINSSNVSNGVLDQSGNGHNATMTNMEDGDIIYAYPRTVYNMEDTASHYFRSGDYSTDNGVIFSTYDTYADPLTLSVWLYFTGSFSSRRMWEQFPYQIYWLSGTNFIAMKEMGGTDMTINIANPFSTNRWYHFVMTCDGFPNNSTVLYRDGVRIGSGSRTSSTVTAPGSYRSDWSIGRCWQYAGSLNNTYVSNMSYIGKFLSECEILELWNDGSPVDPSKLTFSGDVISHWAFDKNDNPTISNGIIDVMNGHDLTSINMTAADIFTNKYPTN